MFQAKPYRQPLGGKSFKVADGGGGGLLYVHIITHNRQQCIDGQIVLQGGIEGRKLLLSNNVHLLENVVRIKQEHRRADFEDPVLSLYRACEQFMTFP